MSEHKCFDDDIEYFDNKTVQFIPNLHFHRNASKFVLGYITSFDVKIGAMKTKVDDTTSNHRWDVSTCVPLKKLITQHQDLLPLISTKKIRNPVKKEIVHQFLVGYMIHPM